MFLKIYFGIFNLKILKIILLGYLIKQPFYVFKISFFMFRVQFIHFIKYYTKDKLIYIHTNIFFKILSYCHQSLLTLSYPELDWVIIFQSGGIK